MGLTFYSWNLRVTLELAQTNKMLDCVCNLSECRRRSASEGLRSASDDEQTSRQGQFISRHRLRCLSLLRRTSVEYRAVKPYQKQRGTVNCTAQQVHNLHSSELKAHLENTGKKCLFLYSHICIIAPYYNHPRKHLSVVPSFKYICRQLRDKSNSK